MILPMITRIITEEVVSRNTLLRQITNMINLDLLVKLQPSDDAPVTDVPTVDAPVTDVPTVDAPVTDVPTVDNSTNISNKITKIEGLDLLVNIQPIDEILLLRARLNAQIREDN